MPNITLATEDEEDIFFCEKKLRDTNWTVVGAPGAMKGVLVTSWMCQFVLLARHCIIYNDLGGDLAAFNVLAQAAEEAGKPVYLVALEEWVDCYGVDFLRNTPVLKHDPKRATPLLSGALRLNTGQSGTDLFWGRHSAADVNKGIEGLEASGKWSFPDFVEQLRLNDSESRNKNHVSEAFLAAEELSRYTRVLSIREKQLFIGQAIEEGALVYFWCPAGQDGGPAKSIVSAANWCTMVEAAVRAESGASERTVHLVVDEYAQIAASGSTTEAILNMARKWNVRLYLILQSWGQVPPDLKDVLRTNCQMCVFDAYNRDDQDWLRSLSKDVYVPDSRSKQVSGFSRASETQSERLEPSLTRNQILEVTGIKSQFFLLLKLGDKYREPIVARVKPAVSLEEHNRLKRTPLPRLEKPIQTPSQKGNSFELVPDPGLLELMNRIQAEHTW